MLTFSIQLIFDVLIVWPTSNDKPNAKGDVSFYSTYPKRKAVTLLVSFFSLCLQSHIVTGAQQDGMAYKPHIRLIRYHRWVLAPVLSHLGMPSYVSLSKITLIFKAQMPLPPWNFAFPLWRFSSSSQLSQYFMNELTLS